MADTHTHTPPMYLKQRRFTPRTQPSPSLTNTAAAVEEESPLPTIVHSHTCAVPPLLVILLSLVKHTCRTLLIRSNASAVFPDTTNTAARRFLRTNLFIKNECDYFKLSSHQKLIDEAGDENIRTRVPFTAEDNFHILDCSTSYLLCMRCNL